ncbi:hypothetical protein V5O48_004482 [Marasmius crinis-equi]|uniref:FAD-binding PCMH-type domain-containing protein n=1 Tax=Marasmius crinis-equi TaxID=585013 RepID=A0ABR3FPX1_9AGAR
MAWKGSSNIDGGFVIDLRNIQYVDISPDRKSVSLGPGSTWREVYHDLAPFNLITTGGRLADVGVGGFFMGGGTSHFSSATGFGSANVFNYELVLSNGTIVNANEGEHPDLYWALKTGSTNYGIVTRFDMHTFPMSSMWGSLTSYALSHSTGIPDILKNWVSYRSKLGKRGNADAVDAAQLILARSNGKRISMVTRYYTEPTPRKPFTTATPIFREERVGSVYDITNEIFAEKFYPNSRVVWYTWTTGTDKQFFWDQYVGVDRILNRRLGDVEGIEWAIFHQPVSESFIEASYGTPMYSSLKGIKDATVQLLSVTWTNPSDDDLVEEVTGEVAIWAEAEARERRLLYDFIYMNYAHRTQPVYERSYSEEVLEKLRRVKKAYDSDGTFDDLWRGGFKIPLAVASANGEDVHYRTEL